VSGRRIDGRGALPVYGQMISTRFPGTPPEVQAPNAFGVPFHLELVGRAAGRHHDVIVIVLKKQKTSSPSSLSSRETRIVLSVRWTQVGLVTTNDTRVFLSSYLKGRQQFQNTSIPSRVRHFHSDGLVRPVVSVMSALVFRLYAHKTRSSHYKRVSRIEQ